MMLRSIYLIFGALLSLAEVQGVWQVALKDKCYESPNTYCCNKWTPCRKWCGIDYDTGYTISDCPCDDHECAVEECWKTNLCAGTCLEPCSNTDYAVENVISIVGLGGLIGIICGIVGILGVCVAWCKCCRK